MEKKYNHKKVPRHSSQSDNESEIEKKVDDILSNHSEILQTGINRSEPLEYELHRPLYEWFLKELEIYAPRQIEFARLNPNYTVMSKRKLIKLVRDGHVRGWDDPRMPTLSGMRRRGFPPQAILEFLNRVGVAKNYNVVDASLLEEIVRDMLNRTALR